MTSERPLAGPVRTPAGAIDEMAACEGRGEEGLPPSRILLVDDDQANLASLSAILEDMGQPITCAHSGEEALRWLLKTDFAVILLDVLMPQMDGYETAALIRRRERTRHVPIIFLSAADADNATLFRGYSAGAVDYVSKPIEPLILRSKVSVFVELHQRALAMQRQARALEESLAQQALIIRSLPIALYTAPGADAFRERRYVGPAVERLCGFPPERFIDDPGFWEARLHEDDRDLVLQALASPSRTGEYSVEYRWLCADDGYRWFSDRSVVVERTAQDEPEIFGMWLDVSERRALEQQLIHAQKMEAVGQMSGAVAHDFNNMLSVIIGSLELPHPAIETDPKLRRRIELAMQAAKSCSALTKRLLGFSRRQALQPRPLSVPEQVVQLRELFARLLNDDIQVVVNCPANTWLVSLDPSQFEAAIVNLAINARDAMPQGGTLTIGSRNLPRNELPSGVGLKPGDYVELSIRDTGAGMSEEVRRQAFEPFFTTKPAGKGTGLGLSSIYAFIRQSGGLIQIDSTPGMGTEVRLLLPRCAPGEDEIEAPAPQKLARLRDQKVLVVDDDEHVLEIAVGVLESLGCKTVAAANANEALTRLDQVSGISLLFTDCMMPGDMDGLDLADEVRERFPDLPVLLTSGQEAWIRSRPPEQSHFPFLPKPYDADGLARALTKLL